MGNLDSEHGRDRRCWNRKGVNDDDNDFLEVDLLEIVYSVDLCRRVVLVIYCVASDISVDSRRLWRRTAKSS